MARRLSSFFLLSSVHTSPLSAETQQWRRVASGAEVSLPMLLASLLALVTLASLLALVTAAVCHLYWHYGTVALWHCGISVVLWHLYWQWSQLQCGAALESGRWTWIKTVGGVGTERSRVANSGYYFKCGISVAWHLLVVDSETQCMDCATYWNLSARIKQC